MKRICVLSFVLCSCISSKEHATVEAKKFAQELGMTDAIVVCQEYDTNGDGYVSCTLKHGENLTPVECRVVTDCIGSGCRIAVGQRGIKF